MTPYSPPTVRDDANGQPLLVKHASGAEMNGLRREAKLLEAAAHLGVVQVRGFLELEDRAELTLTYVPGAPLAEQPPLKWESLLDFAIQLGTTIAGLHDLGISHGAISAEHVLIDQDGRVVLCGFGRASQLADQAADDFAAFVALVDGELARSEDAGLIVHMRNSASELRSAIRFATETGYSSPGNDLRQWLGRLSETARAERMTLSTPRGTTSPRRVGLLRREPAPGRMQPEVGLRPKLSEALKRLLPSLGQNSWGRRWLVVALVAVAGFIIWQWRSGSGNDTPADATSVTEDSASRTATNALVGDNSANGSTGSAGAVVAAEGSGSDSDAGPSGVLLMGVTPERCVANPTAQSTDPQTNPRADQSPGQPPAQPPSPAFAAVTQTLSLDTNGDGCLNQIVVGALDASGQPAIAVDDQRWLLGQPGDLVTVGDWNCDGVSTPAVVRPGSGEAFFFAVWPLGTPTIQPGLVVVAPLNPTGVSAVDAADESVRQCHNLLVSYESGSVLLGPSQRTAGATLRAASQPTDS